MSYFDAIVFFFSFSLGTRRISENNCEDRLIRRPLLSALVYPVCPVERGKRGSANSLSLCGIAQTPFRRLNPARCDLSILIVVVFCSKDKPLWVAVMLQDIFNQPRPKGPGKMLGPPHKPNPITDTTKVEQIHLHVFNTIPPTVLIIIICYVNICSNMIIKSIYVHTIRIKPLPCCCD